LKAEEVDRRGRVKMVGENDQVLASGGCGEDRSDLPSRVIPSHALSKAEGNAKNLGEIASRSLP